jgi:kynureninase
VDFAVWCSYKHLNGGPGGPAFLYVHHRHFDRSPALSGWFGYRKERQFDLRLDFEHQKNAGGWQISTPGILSMAAVRGALEVIHRAGIEEIRKKSLRLTGYLIGLTRQLLASAPYSFEIGTPPGEEQRGGHVALLREDGLRICSALKQRGIIPDYRPENMIRLAPVALYNTFHEVWQTVQALREIIDQRDHLGHSDHRPPVS